MKTYKASKWVYLAVIIQIIGSVSLLLFPYYQQGSNSSWILYGSFSLLFLIVGVIAFVQVLNAKVILFDESVRIYRFLKTDEVSLSEIKKCYWVGGYLVIDCGSRPRPLVPFYIKGFHRELNNCLEIRRVLGSVKAPG